MLKILNTSNFKEEVLNLEIAALVDFFAEWCSPCKMLEPILEELSDFYDKNILIGKVNIDIEPKLTEEYQILSVPTLILFKNGEIVHREVGFVQYEKLKEIINKSFLYKSSK
jgi:thioredoxin 1